MGDNIGDGLLFGSEAHLPPRTQAPAPPHLPWPPQPPPPRSPVERTFFLLFFWLIKILFLVGWLVFALNSINRYGGKVGYCGGVDRGWFIRGNLVLLVGYWTWSVCRIYEYAHF